MRSVSELGDRGQDATGDEGGWELQLDAEGGLLFRAGGFDLQPGDELSVALSLSNGARIRFDALVSFLELTDTDEQGASIEFVDLSPGERREFRRWQAQMRREHGSSRIGAEVRRTRAARRPNTAPALDRSRSLASGALSAFGVWALCLAA